MTPLHAILHAVGGLTIEQLERHIQERAAIVDQMRAEQAALIPHLDLKWRHKAMNEAGPGQLSQVIAEVRIEVSSGQ